MNYLLLTVARLHVALLAMVRGPAGRRRDDRGDVPGWVMVTVMTAGLVFALWQFVGPELKQMLREAFNKVG